MRNSCLASSAIAITLSIEMKSLLIGEAADPEEEAKIVAAITGAEPVRAAAAAVSERLTRVMVRTERLAATFSLTGPVT